MQLRADAGEAVQQDDWHLPIVLKNIQKRLEVDIFDAQQVVLRSGVLKAHSDLNDHPHFGSKVQQLHKSFVTEWKIVIPRQQSDSQHSVELRASLDVIFPFRQRQIDRAEWQQEIGAGGAAFFGQSLIGCSDVVVQDCDKRPGPRLCDSESRQFFDTARRIVQRKPAHSISRAIFSSGVRPSTPRR